MKVNITFSGEISAEEILHLIKGIDEYERNRNSLPNVQVIPSDRPDCYVGKTVKIKSITPESEIKSFSLVLLRDIEYGVTEDTGTKIKIQGMYYPKIWFEIVDVNNSEKKQ